VVAPLIFLLKGGLRQLRWTKEANETFHALKECFTNAPVLAHPDPSLPFIVEVDASRMELRLFSPNALDNRLNSIDAPSSHGS
jgi:hypothetical protein